MFKILSLVVLFTIISQAQGKFFLFDDDAPDVYAIDLNGTNEYGQKTSPTGLDLSAKTYTIIAWIKTPDPINGAGSRSIIGTDANPTRGWSLFLNNAEAWNMWVNAGTGATVGASTEVRAGTWTLIVFECIDAGANSDYEFYIDAINVCASGCVNYTNTVNGSSKLTIGTDGYPQGFYWTSQLGQMQVVSGYALTQAGITALYNKGGTLNASYTGGTVVAWYKWEGATDAEMLNDYSASGNDLTGTNLTTADQVKIGKTYK